MLPLEEELAVLRDWPGLRAVIAIETIRQVHHQPGTHVEIRYYLPSCADSPAVLMEAIRRHWAIENSLHWVLDVVFRKDEARSRDRVAMRSFAVLCKLAFNLLQRGRPCAGSLRARRHQAGWNNDYIAQVLMRSRQKGVSVSLDF